MNSCFPSNKNMMLGNVNVFKEHTVHSRKPCAYQTVADAPLVARAIWVVHSDWPEPKPHGSYDCTLGFSLIERRSSSLSTTHAVLVVILFLCTKCTLISKNVLNIANDTLNAPENQTRGIMVILRTVEIFMRPNDEVTGHSSLNWHISFWKPWSFMWDAPVWKERSSKLVPNFTNFFPRGRESTPQAHIDFDDVRTPSEFPVIKVPTRPTPVAAPRSRNVWNFSPLLEQTDENSQSDAQMICTPLLGW